jgi:hypothetical protein
VRLRHAEGSDAAHLDVDRPEHETTGTVSASTRLLSDTYRTHLRNSGWRATERAPRQARPGSAGTRRAVGGINKGKEDAPMKLLFVKTTELLSVSFEQRAHLDQHRDDRGRRG